jgi:hypothetical protein
MAPNVDLIRAIPNSLSQRHELTQRFSGRTWTKAKTAFYHDGKLATWMAPLEVTACRGLGSLLFVLRHKYRLTFQQSDCPAQAANLNCLLSQMCRERASMQILKTPPCMGLSIFSSLSATAPPIPVKSQPSPPATTLGEEIQRRERRCRSRYQISG